MTPQHSKEKVHFNSKDIHTHTHIYIRLAGNCWRGKDELTSEVLLWTPSDGQERVWGPGRTYLQQLCTDTGCSKEDRPGAMDNRDEWQEISVRATA